MYYTNQLRFMEATGMSYLVLRTNSWLFLIYCLTGGCCFLLSSTFFVVFITIVKLFAMWFGGCLSLILHLRKSQHEYFISSFASLPGRWLWYIEYSVCKRFSAVNHSYHIYYKSSIRLLRFAYCALIYTLLLSILSQTRRKNN